MVEIGPGLGAMTSLLLDALDQMHVVELDRDLVTKLRVRYSANRLIVHQGDALLFDFAQIETRTSEKLRIVGNLPYNISTPLLFHLAAFSSLVKDQHFMLQKEVVERMTAEPGTKAYGRLSVMLQWRYRMGMLLVVPPTAFDPPPRVESAIVRMVPIESPLSCDTEKLELVVTKAFSQRRKVLRNTMAGLFTDDDLQKLGIDSKRRPETLHLEEFVAMANYLS